MSYWDSSALAKLFLCETDSPRFFTLARSLLPVVTAHLARHELHTTFRRKEAEGLIQPGDAAILRGNLEVLISSGIITIVEETDFVRSEFTGVLESCFSAVPPVFVRTNDAIHIATALAAGETKFVSADIRQKIAAEVSGLMVHP